MRVTHVVGSPGGSGVRRPTAVRGEGRHRTSIAGMAGCELSGMGT